MRLAPYCSIIPGFYRVGKMAPRLVTMERHLISKRSERHPGFGIPLSLPALPHAPYGADQPPSLPGEGLCPPAPLPASGEGPFPSSLASPGLMSATVSKHLLCLGPSLIALAVPRHEAPARLPGFAGPFWHVGPHRFVTEAACGGDVCGGLLPGQSSPLPLSLTLSKAMVLPRNRCDLRLPGSPVRGSLRRWRIRG